MDRINAAVVGAGFIGPVHVEALRRAGITPIGIMGISEEESRSAQQSLGLEKAYTSLDEILADPEVHAVHLAVPNRFHYPYATKVLEAGKNVLCEKPLAMDTKESAELVRLAEKSGLAAGVCYNIRFYPINLEVRDMVARGDLGDVFSVVGSYVQDWMLYDTDYNWRVLAEEGGILRAVADIGTHWMDLITSITGLKPKQVFADLKTVHPVRKRPLGEVETFTGKSAEEQETEPIDIITDDAGSVLFRFEGGATGALWVSQITAGRKNCLRYEISGSKSAVAWNSQHPNNLWVGHRERPNEELLRDPSLVSDLARGHIAFPGGHNEGFPDTFKQCFRAFYDAVANKTPASEALYPTFEQGHHEVVLCEAILKSHREERWVDVA